MSSPSEDPRRNPLFIAAKTSVVARLEKENPEVANQVVGDGWLDDMLLNFFTELAKKVGDLFLSLTEPLKNQLKEMGEEIYRSGIERLQPDPPITLEKIIRIAGDATADAIAEQVLIMSGAVCIQLIPFLNISAINQLLNLYADLSPDVEISRIITRRMVDALVREPLDQFMMAKYRPRRMSRADAESAYKAAKLSKEGFAEILAQEGIPDRDIAVILAVTDLEILAKVKTPPAGPTEFETLLGDVALLDSWDGLLAKWLGDLKARIYDLTDLVKGQLPALQAAARTWWVGPAKGGRGMAAGEIAEVEAWLKNPTETIPKKVADALPRESRIIEDLKRKRGEVYGEVREVWGQREKLLTLLSSLRRSFAGAASAQATAVIQRHAAVTKSYAGELAKEARAVIPKAPVARLKMRGTGVPALHDALRRLETAAAAVKPMPVPPPRPIDIFITGMPPLEISVPVALDKLELDKMKQHEEWLKKQAEERARLEKEAKERAAREAAARIITVVTAEDRSRIR